MGTHRLAPDSLAFALLQASRAVEAVILGRNLDVALAREADAAAWPATTRAAVQDLAYATLRDYGRGDFYLARLLARPLEAPLVRALLLIALHRLETHPSAAHTTVDQAVEAAGQVLKGRFKGLVNGVLRNFLRQSETLFDPAETHPVAHNRHPFMVTILKNCLCCFHSPPPAFPISGKKRRAAQRLQRTTNFLNNAVKLTRNLGQRSSKTLPVSRFNLG